MTIDEMFQNWRQNLTSYPLTDQWFQDNKVNIEVLKLASWNSCPDQIKQFVINFKPKRNQCYKNAYECAAQIPGVGYVEGLVMGKMPTFGLSHHVDHAWNVYDGQHFDITPLNFGWNMVNPYLQLLEVRHTDIAATAIFVQDGYHHFAIPFVRRLVNE